MIKLSLEEAEKHNHLMGHTVKNKCEICFSIAGEPHIFASSTNGFAFNSENYIMYEEGYKEYGLVK